MNSTSSSGNIALPLSLFLLSAAAAGAHTPTFLAGQTYEMPAPEAISVADFNRDGLLDLAISCGGSITVELGDGTGKFKTLPLAPAAQAFQTVILDVNGDGIPDIAGAGNNKPFYILGNGDGTFQPPIFLNSNTNSITITAGDINHDGKVDLVVGDLTGVAVLINEGGGNFADPVYYPLGQVDAIAIADVTGDGIADLVVNTDPGIVILAGATDGTFQTFASFNIPGYTQQCDSANCWSSMALRDFNGDGILDILLCPPYFARRLYSIPFSCS